MQQAFQPIEMSAAFCDLCNRCAESLASKAFQQVELSNADRASV
jgi:hypothetical protein